MITRKTVLVLGAGASYAYGFPLGVELKDRIYSLVNSGYAERLGCSKEEAEEFSLALARTPVYSIDAFLERRPEFINIGKKFIAFCLLPHEKTKVLFEDIIIKRIHSRQSKNTLPVEDWYQYLFNLLGNSPDQFLKNQLVVVTFNYDRSLEHYIFEGLKNSFNLDDEDCRRAISSIRFIHIYGSLGKLPWQNVDRPDVPYDAWVPDGPWKPDVNHREIEQKKEAQRELINQAAASIKILHENPDHTPELVQARNEIQDADKVLFLGFGFHTINVQRLLPGDIIKKDIFSHYCPVVEF